MNVNPKFVGFDCCGGVHLDLCSNTVSLGSILYSLDLKDYGLTEQSGKHVNNLVGLHSACSLWHTQRPTQYSMVCCAWIKTTGEHVRLNHMLSDTHTQREREGRCDSSREKHQKIAPTNRASGNSSSWARYRTSSSALDPSSTSPLHLDTQAQTQTCNWGYECKIQSDVSQWPFRPPVALWSCFSLSVSLFCLFCVHALRRTCTCTHTRVSHAECKHSACLQEDFTGRL